MGNTWKERGKKHSLDFFFFHIKRIINDKVFLPLTYAAMASGVSLSGSMVMRSGVRFGRDFILSEEHKHKRK